MGQPRILFADDHLPMHEMVRRILEPEFEVVATVADGHELIKAAQEDRPDVLVVDISMPGLDGIQAVKRLQNGDEAWTVVFLSTHTDHGLVKSALEAGALGYVLKLKAAEELPLAIHEALAGRSFVSPTIRDAA